MDENINEMRAKAKKMTNEEIMVELKRVDPKFHRTLTAFINAREEGEKIPDAFCYVRALQEYDKEHGVKPVKGEYIYMLEQFNKITELVAKNDALINGNTN